jgi:hypothetical protein
MSFLMQRYPLRWAAYLRRQADAKKACSCTAQRYNAMASQLECLPGSYGRAKVCRSLQKKKKKKKNWIVNVCCGCAAQIEFGQFVGRFQSGNYTGADVLKVGRILLAWGAAWMLGGMFGRKNVQGHFLYR